MEINTNVQLADLGRALLQFKGTPLSLQGYAPFKDIYNTTAPMMTMRCSRQVGKTLSMGGIIVVMGIAYPFTTSIYIAPLAIQASRFSSMYLDGFLNSPLVKKYWRDTSSRKNVFEKSLSNESKMFLSYAQVESDSDRVRGIAGDFMHIDEVQDIQWDALPVLYECLSGSQEHGNIRHYGTAKSELNTLEVLFKKSSGNEWCIKCPHCGKWVIPWTLEECLKICSSDIGPVCSHCYKPIDVTKGKWVAARPHIKDHIGFHVARFTLEARTTKKKWKELRDSIRDYPTSKLANEVFGIPAGIAGRILSEKEVMECCNPLKTQFDSCWPMDYRGINSVVLGVDWSVTGGEASYTVATVLGYDYMGKCYVLYSERMQGIDILEQVKRVEQIYHQFNCQLIGSDRGVGVLQGQLLKQSLGQEKVVMVQYCSAKQVLRMDCKGDFMAADRTQVMDVPILKMKLGINKFETPCWSLMADYWKDALSIYEEESLSGRRLYRKDEGATDDWLHSIVFGNVAYMALTGQYSYYAKEDD